MKSLPIESAALTSSTAEHRRLMATKGQLHLTRLAAAAANAPYEPLPRRERTLEVRGRRL
jgi:hypothetical protein